MNTKKLYISSLRIVFKEGEIKNKHVKWVIVKSNNIHKGKFRDIETNELYTYDVHDIGDIGLLPRKDMIFSFNDVTGNTKKYLSKKKILKLCSKKRMEE